MSTLVAITAQQAGTGLIQAAGQYAQNYAVQSVARLFDNRRFEGPRLESFHIQTSRDGAPMPRVFGRARLSGQVIWASQVLETATTERAGGKGGPTLTNFSYSISFAVGLCEGEILAIDRIWANGTILPTANISMRVYKGGEDQAPDPIIQAIDGPDVPAFNGTSYVVFEDFPLDEFGGRLPQLSFEVQRVPRLKNDAPRLEDLVQSVCLLPSSGEFAYASETVEDRLGAGQSFNININNLSGQTDIERALDQLENQLPNCRHVSIIISWFGTDLRMEQCELHPGVERPMRNTDPLIWSVGGIERSAAYQVSRDENDRPVFGGTPSDESILQAINALKSRGYAVTLYPFILMDIPPDNDLPNPYNGEASQPVFPWRGRITCSPAPGQVGTPDQTDQMQSSTNAFLGGAQISDFNIQGSSVFSPRDDFGYRRFILHYAHLAKLSGQVDNFLIGSELRSLTQLRDHQNNFPFVTGLAELAGDVKTVLGYGTQLSYAADWSEYFGYHPQDGSGDVFFHLDSLWAHPAISAVSIDSYIPLSDWRDGDNHLDAADYDDIYDLDYLQSNVQGGEGYDWFYASQADRDAQTRSPITDGLAGQNWVFRFKDFEQWWSNPHYNRIGGVISEVPTDWQPRSKPFWITELGCPAIDKGANQPNVFVDPKSSESFAPYFSQGSRDDLIQRRYIEAFLDFWADAHGRNPSSPVYNGDMIDLSRVSIWTWDARPYPDFPARSNVWADGENWELGHWLTGRTGLVPLSDVVDELAGDAGITQIDTARLFGLVEGYVVDRPMTARAALEPLSLVYGFNVIERAGALTFVSDGFEVITDLSAVDLIEGPDNEPRIVRADMESELLDVRLQFIESAQDYQLGSLSVRNRLAETVRVLDIGVPIILSRPLANFAAETLLEKSLTGREALSLALSPARYDLEVGDIFRLPPNNAFGDDTLWLLQEMQSEPSQINSRAVRVEPRRGLPPAASTPAAALPTPQTPQPFPVLLDTPDPLGRDLAALNESGPLVGARRVPFISTDITVADGAVNVDVPIMMGVLSSVLKAGPLGRIDHANHFDAVFMDGTLSSVDEAALLSGGNSFAVETDTGWEILSARDAVLIGARTYRLSYLIRGIAGTDADMMDTILAGARIILLSGARGIGGGLTRIAISEDNLGADVNLQAFTSGRESEPESLTYEGRHLRPLSPVHGAYNPMTHEVSWIRRARIGANRWTGLDIALDETREVYRVQTYNGEVLLQSEEVSQSAYTLPVSFVDSATHLAISQGSDLYGFGPALQIPLLP